MKSTNLEVGMRTRRRPKRTGLCRGYRCGPVVVPNERDYAAASMRKGECGNQVMAQGLTFYLTPYTLYLFFGVGAAVPSIAG